MSTASYGSQGSSGGGSGSAGGGTAFVTTAQARAKALSVGQLDAALSTYGQWFEDFADTSAVVKVSGAGSPTALPSQTLKGGVLTTSSVTNPGYCASVPVGQGPMIVNPTTDIIYAAWRVRFDGPVDANTFCAIGLTVAASPISGASSGYTYFGINAVNGGGQVNFAVTVYDGTTTTCTATSTPIDTASFHLVEFYSNGTTGTWYLDGVAMSVTTTMANVGGRPMTIDCGRIYGTAVSHVVNVDKAYTAFLAQ